MKVKQSYCDCKGCIHDIHVTFINHMTREVYHLCRDHYIDWIQKQMEISYYISTSDEMIPS